LSRPQSEGSEARAAGIKKALVAVVVGGGGHGLRMRGSCSFPDTWFSKPEPFMYFAAFEMIEVISQWMR
jgi:hypothetical protein